MSRLLRECPIVPTADLTEFVNREQRLPRLGDAQAPWQFRGWLLPYVIRLHSMIPAVADRWGYHLRTLEAGRLPDEPIPHITFGPPDTKVFSLLRDWSKLIGRDCGGWSDFRMLLDWLSWGLSLTSGMPELPEDVQEKLYRNVNLGPLLEHPYDYLGTLVAEGKANGWNPTAFYPTPHEVVELMVSMLSHDVSQDDRDPRLYSVLDPCVGSGRMLMHFSNVSLNLWGQDIDPLAVSMCKINGALYVPWMSFPLSARILGTHVKPPPPSLPVPVSPQAGVPIYRVDDRRQRSLFDD